MAKYYEVLIKEECTDELSDIEAPREPDAITKDPFSVIVNQLCPGDCNGHGTCSSSECLSSLNSVIAEIIICVWKPISNTIPNHKIQNKSNLFDI